MILYSGRVRDLGEDLAGGVVCCPACGGRLRPWGHARARPVRSWPGSELRWWRPRRARCRSCSATHVLLPTALLPRRRDTVEVVGAALAAYAAGQGHRRIASRLGRPGSTVRNWVRGFGRQAEHLRVAGTRCYCELDANIVAIHPSGSPASDALEALGLAARASLLRFGPFDRPWAVINIITAGQLITPSDARPRSI